MTGTDGAKILVVDDTASQRLATEAALAELGEPVVTVDSGGAALRLLLEQDFAVIILDVNMPEMDGFETATLIRARPRSRLTPIIFVTADPDELRAPRAYSLGAVDYMISPILPEVLRAKVRVFVELSKAQAQVRREAEQRIVLSREQAARVAAEEESRRLRVLAGASGALARSLDTPGLVRHVLGAIVPAIAEAAVIVLRERPSLHPEASWLHVDDAGLVRAEPIPGGRRTALEAAIGRVLNSGQPETLSAEPPDEAHGLVLPLVTQRWTFGALAVVAPGSAAYAEADRTLVHDVANRAAIALENSRLYEEIRARDRQKDEFLAMLSHELRNPLGAITTAAGLLDLVGPGDVRAARAREVIARQASHLTRMIDDLLDVGRLTAGRISVMKSPVDLAETVRRALDALRQTGRLDRHAVALRASPVIVEADATRMEQVVTNLLVNALKYTDPGGRIDVDVAAEGDEAVVRVRDTGVGISRELLPRLFDLFAQGGQTLDRSQGGLGVGLTLVRHLVELQGGRVEAWSDGPGCGSLFTVALPRLSAEPAPPVEPDVEPPAAVRRRVLVIEDNADARAMLCDLLRHTGHDVYEAGDGATGVECALRFAPDVALIDLGLPGMDGLEVARRVRGSDVGSRIMLVAVTGYGQAGDRRETLDAGFDVHLVKPVEIERLTEVLALATGGPVWRGVRGRPLDIDGE
jgi:signal transduction histidine kinase/DNA-binding response OmpR family regulator